MNDFFHDTAPLTLRMYIVDVHSDIVLQYVCEIDTIGCG